MDSQIKTTAAARRHLARGCDGAGEFVTVPTAVLRLACSEEPTPQPAAEQSQTTVQAPSAGRTTRKKKS
jgi:hypothetical protein